jgi:hypothetical protein
MRRLSATSPDILASLPASLGAHLGTPFLEASPADLWGQGGGSVVAVDSGADLAEWEDDLLWLDRKSGEPVMATTDDSVHPWDGVLVESLDSKAAMWGFGSMPAAVGGIFVDPHLIQYKGHLSGELDAQTNGTPGDTSALRPDYGGADLAAYVVAEARRLGATGFANRYALAQRTAEGICGGRRPSRATIAGVMAAVEADERTCLLDGCDVAVGRPNQRYCTDAHRKAASRLRAGATSETPALRRPRRAEPEMVPVTVTCSGCGMFLMGETTRRGTCSDCVEAVAS